MVKNETSVASPTTAVNPAVKSAVDKAKEAEQAIAAANAALDAKHAELAAMVGKIVIPKHGAGSVKVVEFYPRYAFGHRLVPAYRLEVDGLSTGLGKIVACDELSEKFIVE